MGEHPPASSRSLRLFSSSADPVPRSQALGSSVLSRPRSAARSAAGRKWASRPSAARATSSQSTRALAYSGASLWAVLSSGEARRQPGPRLAAPAPPTSPVRTSTRAPPPHRTHLPPVAGFCPPVSPGPCSQDPAHQPPFRAPVLTSAAPSTSSPESSGGARTGRAGRTGPPHLGEGRAESGERTGSGTPGVPVRASLPRVQTFVEEDAGHPERGEKQREILAAVHSTVGAGHHGRVREGAGGGRRTLLAPGSLAPRLATSRHASLGSVDALELRRAGGKRRGHAEGPAR